jgi:hypothetical protein
VPQGLGTLTYASAGAVANSVVSCSISVCKRRLFSSGPSARIAKFSRLAGQEFAAERGERLVQALQLLDGLGQNGLCFHNVSRNSPFLAAGFSRTRLKNST